MDNVLDGANISFPDKDILKELKIIEDSIYQEFPPEKELTAIDKISIDADLNKYKERTESSLRKYSAKLIEAFEPPKLSDEVTLVRELNMYRSRNMQSSYIGGFVITDEPPNSWETFFGKKKN